MRLLTRRWLINLALLALLAVLALAVWLDVREAQRASQLTSLTPAAIDSIVLHRAGEPTVRLVRRELGWRMLAPYAVPADTDAVARLLPVARARVVRTLPAAGLDRAELGLEPSALRVSLNGLELRFGGTEPVAQLRYVQAGDMVHLIEDRFLPRLMTPTTALVSRRLLPPEFSPALGAWDSAPLTAGQLAPLAEAAAERVTAATAALTADAPSTRSLRIDSADGGDGLHFRVSDDGRRWTRPDLALSWLFATPPLAAVTDEPTAAAPMTSTQRPAGRAPAATVPQRADALPVERRTRAAPGVAPLEPRPTAAVANLLDLVPAQRPNKAALPQSDTDPFAQPARPALRSKGAAAPPRTEDVPLRTEQRSP